MTLDHYVVHSSICCLVLAKFLSLSRYNPVPSHWGPVTGIQQVPQVLCIGMVDQPLPLLRQLILRGEPSITWPALIQPVWLELKQNKYTLINLFGLPKCGNKYTDNYICIAILLYLKSSCAFEMYKKMLSNYIKYSTFNLHKLNVGQTNFKLLKQDYT